MKTGWKRQTKTFPISWLYKDKRRGDQSPLFFNMAYEKLMSELNRIVQEELGYSGKAKGTSYWYYAGTIGNQSACYTRAKTHYEGRYGFWSWIQTKYQNGKIKRRRFALSASKKKAEYRAIKLLKELEERRLTHDQEKMPQMREIQGNDQTLEDRKPSPPIHMDVQEMSR
jgi:hypothetical protein